ncbi:MULTISPECIES: hypothetical protein [Streptomyces]|uniref:hypothetical protein n=1 Tax=Streptomyces TaxID=1883 RepID=UPI00364E94AC
MATLSAETVLEQLREATGFETRADRPVRVVDMDGNEYDVSQVIASTQHGGEVRICVEPKNYEG